MFNSLVKQSSYQFVDNDDSPIVVSFFEIGGDMLT